MILFCSFFCRYGKVFRFDVDIITSWCVSLHGLKRLVISHWCVLQFLLRSDRNEYK